jgi:GR25 family glycosyltransferase involved in LPS biosynthesis
MEKIDIIIDELKNKHKKIKIVHLQTTINTENEKKSQAFIEKFKNFGVEYINIKNKLYHGYDHYINCKYPKLLNADSDDKLTNRHYGCFDSYRKAILKEFNDDTDFLITCEGDCLFEISHEDFIKYLNKIIDICEKENISYFSFGDSKTLDNKVLQSSIIEIPENQSLCYITDKIIGIQCVMFNKNIKNLLINDFKNKPWYVADGWFNDFCYNNNLKMGIVFNRFTSQYDGESFIDKRVKNF